MQASIATQFARAIGRWIRCRPAEIAWPGGVVSFTFDDFPKSALTAGGAILEKFGRRGTYYAAPSLAGSNGKMGPLFDAADLVAAHAAGHELGCHTYSHLDCSRAPIAAILADLEASAAAFAALVDGFVPTSFAYPFGALSLGARRVLAARFASCRGVGGGINRGIADLANLGSVQIYDASFDEDRLHRLIDGNRAVGGWLIFYTHDVSPNPSPYGCTPGQLDAVVAHAAESCEVLPVRDVVAGLARQRPAAQVSAGRRLATSAKIQLPGFSYSRE